MTKLTVTNKRDETITLTSDEREKRLIEFDIQAVEADVQTQKAPYQDGAAYIDSQLETRDLSIEFILRNREQRELERMKRQVGKVLNPKLGVCELRYENEDGTWIIDAVPEESPYYPQGDDNRLPGFQRGEIDLIAPNPYFRDTNRVSQSLTAYEGYFKLPTKLPFKLGKQGDQTTLKNDGDIPVPVQIDIQGPVKNPEIRNTTTDKFIRVNRSIASDEILHIDTEPGNKRIEVYKGSQIMIAMGSLDYVNGAEFWQLEPGDNRVEYYADSGNKDAIVAVSWSNRYISI